jgi:hypothetical protein
MDHQSKERKQDKMNGKKTCFYCKNAEINPGYPDTRLEPGEPASAECQVESEYENQCNYKGNYEEYAEKCPKFNPRMIEKCPKCGKIINSPLWSHTIYAPSLEDYFPVCSEECRKKAEDELSKMVCEHADII